MSSATKPRRPLNGGTSPSRGRGRSPPQEREMVQRNHRRGARTPSSAFRSPRRWQYRLRDFPSKTGLRGSAPPLAPFPSTSPLTRRPHRRRPFVRVRRRSHRGRRQRPGRRRPQGGAALPSPLARRGREGAHQSSVAAVKGFENQANQIAEAIKKQERGDGAVDPMVMHPPSGGATGTATSTSARPCVCSRSRAGITTTPSTCPRWAAGTCSGLSSTSTTGSTS